MITDAGTGRGGAPTPRQGRFAWKRLALAATLLTTMLTVGDLGTGSVVTATNDLTLSVSTPGEQLLTDPAVIPVTLTANNPSGGGQNGYNGSFTAILPVGATYIGGAIAPAAQSTLSDGRTALFFENVGDIQDGSSLSLGFTFSVTATDFPVGSTVPVVGHFGANTDPRTVPDFDPVTGAFGGDTTGLTPTGTSSTLLTPLAIDKTNLTAIANELVRGVHDHVATYQLLVTNNGVANDNLVVVDDFVPAVFEYLGCGGVDNTVDATGTNPGSTLEYPGADPLSDTAAPAGACPAPNLVEMVTVTGGVITSGSSTNGTAAPPSVADGVYTHLRWALGTLTPANYAAPVEIQYQVGIPIKQNVYVASLNTETGTDPTAYLDNNTGGYTTEDDGSELQARNFSSVRGTYTGPVAPGFDPVDDTTDEDDHVVSVEDLAIQKSASVPDPLVQGSIVQYDLNIQTSEYRTITAAVITDTLSDGQCPLRTGGTDPEASPQSGECAVVGYNPTFPFTTVTEAADGSFTVVWNSTTAPVLASLPANTVTTISFFAKVRTSYQDNFDDQAPFNGADGLSNEVDIEGTTNLITGIPDDPSIDDSPIQDTGSAGYQAGNPLIDKSISLPVAPAGTLDCNTASWVSTSTGAPPAGFPYAYRIGDRVCFRLGVDFNDDLNFRNARVDDFLPLGTVFEQVWQTTGAFSGLSAADSDPTGATANNQVVVDSIEVSPGGDLVTWNLGAQDPDTVGSPYENDLFVTNGGERFEVIVSAIVTEAPSNRTSADIKANLQKFTTVNLANQSVSLRDQADFQVVQPNLRASKTAVPTIAVQGQPISYTASVTNIFSNASASPAPHDPAFARALNVSSWDLLPAGISCSDVSGIALDLAGSFSCVDGLSAGRSGIAFTVNAIDPQQTANLTYTVAFPLPTPAGAVRTNDVGVRQYEGTPTNDGDPSNDPVFVPASNIDPSLEPLANMPPAEAQATVTVPAPEVLKEQQSSFAGPGNVMNPALADTTDEATIGESVQYRASAVVIAGTTVYNANLSDSVPAGMRIVSVDSVELFDQGPGTTTDISGGALGFGFTSDGTSWAVTFPARYDNLSGTGDDTVTVVYTAVVEDVAGNSVGDDLDNTTRLVFDDALVGGATTTTDSPAVTVRVVEPNPQVAKSNNAASPAIPGAEITYTLAVTNPAAVDTSAAYDVVIVDTVPVEIDPLASPGGAAMVADGTITGPSGSVGDWDQSARTITWTQVATPALAQIDPGASTITLDYAALLRIPSVADLALVNTADLTATSLPLAVWPDERTSYTSQSQSTVLPRPAAVGKTIPSGQTTYAIGEIVDFEASFTFPAGTVGFDTTVFDQLPAELTFDSFGTPSFSGPACQIFDPVLGVGTGAFMAGNVVTFGPGVGGDSQRIAWYFNELAADPAAAVTDCTVTLPYSTHVNTVGADGSTFSNGIDLVWNAQDDVVANPPSLPAGFDDPASTNWDRTVGPAEVTIDIAEPQLDVDIDTLTPASALPGFSNDQTAGNDTAGSDDPDGTAATTPGGIDGNGGDVAPGEQISQRVTVTNNGNADAFDTTVVVTVGVGVTPLATPGGTRLVAAGTVTGPGGEVGQWDPTTRTITYLPADNTDLEAAIAAGDQVLLGYDVELDASDSLADLQDITDAVDIPTYFGVPTAEQGQPDVPTYGNDAPPATRGAVDPDATTIEVHFPELGVVKSAISDATDARFDSTFTFRIVITNTDAVATAYDVDASDALPVGWNYVAGSAVVTSPANAGVQIEPVGGPGGPLVWTDLDTLAPAATITIVYDAQPDSAVLAPDKTTGIANTGSFAHTNTVDVVADDATGSPTFDGGTPIAANDDQDVFIRQVDLSIDKAISSPLPPTPIYFGGFVEYEITVTNAGPDDATGVELTDDNLANTGLPTDTILFVGVVSADRGTYDGATGVWTVGDVAAGETLALVVRTQMNTVDPPAPAVNEVEVSAADQFDVDSDPANLPVAGPVEDDEDDVSISPLPTTLGNYIWLDLDGDGIQDVTEPGIPDVDVVVTWTEPGGQARQVTVTTDSGGAYNVPTSFTDEVIGGSTSLPSNTDITVTVDTTSPNLSGLTPIDGPESDVDGGADDVSVVQITTATGVLLPDGVTLARLDVDFGYQPQPQALGNRLWWDQDASGDASDGVGEYGIGGATVDITWYGFDGVLGTTDDLTFETVTSDGNVDVDGVGGADPAGTWSSLYDPGTGNADRNIPPGRYDVSVDVATLPSGLTVDTFDLDGTTDGALTATNITLALNEQRSDVDFSITGVGVIGDTIWFDHDGSGAQDTGEPGISGVVVQLTWAGPDGDFGTTDDNAVLTTTTSDGTTDVDGDTVIDPAGTYVFPNLPDGDFEIVVDPLGTTLPADLAQTGDPDVTVDGTSTVTLDSSIGSTVDLDQDFGYQGDLAIGDLVFYDLDANGTGVVDGNDVALAGVDVTVTWAGNDGTFGTPDDFATTVTTSDGTVDPLGTYQVDGLPSGEYRVEVDPLTLPSGLTTPTFDFDEPGAPLVIATPNVSLITLAGSDDLDQDFSYTGSGAVGDRIWWDKNEDGVQDVDEPGMPGLTVTLSSPGFDGILGTADDLLVTTTTSDGTTDVDGDSIVDPAGSYWFPNLPLGVPLTVTVDDTDLATMPATHDRDDTADGAVAVGTPNSASLTLTTGAPTVDDVDFGYSGVGSVGDTVWLDLDGNGTQEPGEPGLAGVAMDVRFAGPDGLFDTVDDVVEITTTSDGTIDVDGDGLIDPPGSYYVDSLPLDAPIRVTVVTVGPDALPAELAPTADADGAVATPNVSVVTLTAPTPADLDQDFGYTGPGSVGDTVWYDVNADGAADPVGQGVFDSPDVPLIGVAVTVTGAGLDGALDTSDDIVIDLITDVNGEYLATGLPYGDYRVEVDASSLPAGVTTQTYDPDVDLDATSEVTLSVAAPQDLDQDFSFTSGGAVGDTVWFDQNGNGVQDPGEPGLVGIPITITSPGPDGIAGTADDLSIATVTSDGTTDVDGDLVLDPPGSYYVANLPLDVPLTVTVDNTALPAGMVPVFDADGITTAHVSTVTLTAADPVDLDQDFGYAGLGSLGDTVFLDSDGIDSGGLPDTAAGDVGIAGVTLTLTWNNPTGGPPLVVTTVTSDGTTDVDGDTVVDPPGSYTFLGLPEGDYTVAVDPASLPDGLVPVYDPEGDADLESAITLTTAVPSDIHRDFSFAGTGSIGDTVWLDLNADGVIDATETGVPGVVVTLEFSDPTTGTSFTVTTVTDADGLYGFDNLPAGDYTVSYDPDSLPTGYGAVSDPDTVVDGSATLSLADGEARDDLDFGVRPMATVEGVIFNDVDGDGVQGPDEPGIEGVVVEITDSNGDVVTVTTDADGAYVAVDVLAGDLTVDVDDTTLPDDVQLTTGNDPHTITAPPGETSQFEPIGYAPLSFINGTIWFDVDAAGDRDTGEPGLAGVTVELLDGDGVVIATTTTGPDGFYQFTNIPTGEYSVRVDTSTLPAGLDRQTFDPDGLLDGTHPITLTTAGAADRDFGYTGTGSVSDTLWADTDNDGVQDSGEPAVPGVSATLTWAGPDGVLGTDDDVVLTAVTGADGEFEFPNLPAGAYRIVIDANTIPSQYKLVGSTSATFNLNPGQALVLDTFRLVPASVPVTGSSAMLLGQIAVLVFGAGVVLLLASRSRRRRLV